VFGSGARGPLVAPLIARAIVAVVFSGFCSVALITLLAARAPASSVVAIFVLQLVAGVILLCLPPAIAWPAYVSVIVGIGVTQAFLTHSALDVAYSSIAAGVFGLALYGLTRLAKLIIELHTARTELVSTAVAHERLGFARDLHDLLGLSLSAIAPKGELAYRLVDKNPDRARHELAEIQDISRRALADARSVAHGYCDLDEVSRTAESVLAASLVEVRMDLNHGELPVHISAALAATLREGVADVLERCDAERCDIVMRQAGHTVSLDIVNDGVPSSANPDLIALSSRATSLGGELTTGLDADGRYRLHLTLPVSGAETVSTGDLPTDQVPASQLAAVVFSGTAALSALHLVANTHAAVAICCVVGVLYLQLHYFSHPNIRPRSLPSHAMLALQACLVVLPLLFGAPWLALPGFLAGNALIVLHPLVGVPLFATIAAGVAVQSTLTGGPVDVVINIVGVLVSGLVIYGLTWMTRSVAELRATRVQLAQVAVAEERLRFARDLHDLLGLSLSAITLKSELAHRLVTRCTSRARQEVTEILEISRLALADVRLVASGYRELSLHDEVRTAESLLAAAEVTVHLDINYQDLPTHVATLLATVLREGVTNILRHSKGDHCDITVHQHDHTISLDIVNNGVPPTPTPSGTGIHNLSHRASLLGGEVTAGLQPDGRFHLHARIPA
jgi:signal transduction histidine kinase